MSETQRKIENYLKRVYFSDSIIKRDKDNFIKIVNDRTIVGSGTYHNPIKYRNYVIAYLKFSPKTKGDKPIVIYDFIDKVSYKRYLLLSTDN